MRQQQSAPFFIPSVPRHFKKYILAQIVILGIVLYVWYSINGGLIPKFLVPKLPFLNVGPDIGPLVYFDVNSDASKIIWARDANSRSDVQKAIKNPQVHMIEADIILRGQGTKSQSLVPVMAAPPKTDGELTLKDWLQKVNLGTKGIKLHIHSMEAVEISLQILGEFHKQSPMKFPVWVHADILQGPHGGLPVIDHNRFFKSLKLFPKCTISLGWTTDTHSDLSQSAYEWPMVWDMLKIVKDQKIKDTHIVFQARLSLIHNSVPQLKWLFDNIQHSTVLVWHEKGDVVVSEDIMYLSYRFPPHGIYFDMNHNSYQTLLTQYRHFSRDKVDDHVLKRDEVMFKPQAWLKMGFHVETNSILPSTEAVVLAEPITYIISKSKYAPTSEVYLQGRVQFFNRNNREQENFHSGLNIYVRPTDYQDFNSIAGIRCFLGVGGEFEISGSNLPEGVKKFRDYARITTTPENCYRFMIVDDGTKVHFSVTSLFDCKTLESVRVTEEYQITLSVEIPRSLHTTEQHPFILKTSDNTRQALIDELSIKHKA